MKKLLLTCLLLTSCSSLKSVYVPVNNTPQFTIPNKPKLLTASLNEHSTAMQVEKAHVIDIDALITYSDRMRAILETIKNSRD